MKEKKLSEPAVESEHNKKIKIEEEKEISKPKEESVYAEETSEKPSNDMVGHKRYPT